MGEGRGGCDGIGWGPAYAGGFPAMSGFWGGHQRGCYLVLCIERGRRGTSLGRARLRIGNEWVCFVLLYSHALGSVLEDHVFSLSSKF
jgi:hypothetical protein